MKNRTAYKVLKTGQQFAGIVLFRLLIVFTAVYVSHAQAAITLRGAEQNAITSATPPPAITHIGAGSAQAIMGCGNVSPSIPAGNVGYVTRTVRATVN